MKFQAVFSNFSDKNLLISYHFQYNDTAFLQPDFFPVIYLDILIPGSIGNDFPPAFSWLRKFYGTRFPVHIHAHIDYFILCFLPVLSCEHNAQDSGLRFLISFPWMNSMKTYSRQSVLRSFCIPLSHIFPSPIMNHFLEMTENILIFLKLIPVQP